MAKDFRASQIQTSKLIASGGIAGTTAGIAIYSGSNSSNTTGGITDSKIFDNVGSDVFLFVSGTATKTGTTRGEIALFGGDVVISGTLYAERQIIEVDSGHFSKEYFAERPDCERLINKKLDDLSLNTMRDWKVALSDYLKIY